MDHMKMYQVDLVSSRLEFFVRSLGFAKALSFLWEIDVSYSSTGTAIQLYGLLIISQEINVLY